MHRRRSTRWTSGPAAPDQYRSTCRLRSVKARRLRSAERDCAMPEYLSPGVYVEEVDAGPQPIEGVSTSITGAVGVTEFGRTSGKPGLGASFAEFMQNFGGVLPAPPSHNYHAVSP